MHCVRICVNDEVHWPHEYTDPFSKMVAFPLAAIHWYASWQCPQDCPEHMRRSQGLRQYANLSISKPWCNERYGHINCDGDRVVMWETTCMSYMYMYVVE